MPRNITAFLLLSLCPLVGAQSEPETLYRYEVEVIVLRHLGGSGVPTDEVAGMPDGVTDLWPESTPDDEPSANVTMPTSDDAPTSDLATEAEAGVSFRPLTGSDSMLSDVAATIESDQSYKLLAHRSWSQPEIEFGNPSPVRINNTVRLFDPEDDETNEPVAVFGDAVSEDMDMEDSLIPLELDGWVSFTIGRFNHLTVDLQLRERVTISVSRDFDDDDDAASPEPIDRSFGPFDRRMEVRPQTEIRAWRIVDRRRTRFDQTQYFDTETFGVIAQARRIELTPEPNTELENNAP